MVSILYLSRSWKISLVTERVTVLLLSRSGSSEGIGCGPKVFMSVRVSLRITKIEFVVSMINF